MSRRALPVEVVAALDLLDQYRHEVEEALRTGRWDRAISRAIGVRAQGHALQRHAEEAKRRTASQEAAR